MGGKKKEPKHIEVFPFLQNMSQKIQFLVIYI